MYLLYVPFKFSLFFYYPFLLCYVLCLYVLFFSNSFDDNCFLTKKRLASDSFLSISIFIWVDSLKIVLRQFYVLLFLIDRISIQRNLDKCSCLMALYSIIYLTGNIIVSKIHFAAKVRNISKYFSIITLLVVSLLPSIIICPLQNNKWNKW